MSVSDIEKQIKEMYDFEASSSTIYRIINVITTEVVICQKIIGRSLSHCLDGRQFF
jgi:hypothetical protein